MPERSPEGRFDPTDPTQREMMDSIHNLSEEAQKQYFDERNPDFLNYKGFKTLLDRRVAAAGGAREHERSFLRVVFADLNKLKQINDTYGHQAGDKAIAAVIGVLKEFNPSVKDRPLYLEDFDKEPVIAARHTRGDEFTLLFSGADGAELEKIMESVREKLSSLAVEVAPGKTIPLSLSFGAADWGPGKTSETLLSEADQAMYTDKNAAK